MVTDAGAPGLVETDAVGIIRKLERLRRELIDSAYALDARGQHQAADLAMTTSARIDEMCEEYAACAANGLHRERVRLRFT